MFTTYCNLLQFKKTKIFDIIYIDKKIKIYKMIYPNKDQY